MKKIGETRFRSFNSLANLSKLNLNLPQIHPKASPVKKKKRSEIFLQEQPCVSKFPPTQKKKTKRLPPQKVTLIHKIGIPSSRLHCPLPAPPSRWHGCRHDGSQCRRCFLKPTEPRLRCLASGWGSKAHAGHVVKFNVEPKNRQLQDVLFCGHVLWFVSSSAMYDFKQREEFPLYHCIPYVWCMSVCADVFHT